MKAAFDVLLFILIIGCSICYYFIAQHNRLDESPQRVLMLIWVPACAAIISKLIFDHKISGIGWKWCGFKTALLCYFLPVIICIIVYGFVWIFGIGRYKHIMSFIHLIIYSIAGIFISAISAIGEEIGWRGFLLTELKKYFEYNKICLILGIVWFVYHIPAMLVSTYNNGNILSSVICFFFSVMGMTYVSVYICLKTSSLWPGVILHASYNLFVQNVFEKMTVSGPVTKYITSEFGIGLAFIYCLVGFYLYKKSYKLKNN